MLEVKQKRRDQMSIIADILEISRGGILKTQIMYRANLSYLQLNRYLSLLLSSGLIAQSVIEGKDTYIVTEEGAGFLGGYRKLSKTLHINQQNATKKVKPLINFQAPKAVP